MRQALFEQSMEAELRRSEELFRLAFENAPIGMALVDLDGKWLNVNPAFCNMVGYTNQELQTIDFQTITHPDDLVLDLELVRDVLAGVIPSYQLEKRYIHKNGSTIWGLLNVSLLRDEKNTPLHFISQIQDITERKQREEEIERLNHDLEINVKKRTQELEETNQDLENYTYTLTHDLRQPLHNLTALTSEIVNEYAETLDEEGKYMLYLIKQNAEKMDNLIVDLMEFARAKIVSLNKEELNMKKLFEEEIKIAKKEYPHNQMQIFLPTLLPASGDNAAITLVCKNLISNAFKYSSKEKIAQIAISSWRKNNMIIYQVSDNGVGFDLNKKEHLFTIFKRLHSAKEFAGTGVGLAMCERIIKKHGGRMWADSTKGEGATFFFSLPSL